MRLTAAVIGLGKIGMGYDYENIDNSLCLTHASGFSQHPDTCLVGGVDPDASARAKFEKKFGVRAFSSIEDLFGHVRPDMVSVGISSDRQLDVARELIANHVPAILCEKPLASTLADALAFQKNFETSKTLVMVNYPRRFDPAVIEFKNRMNAGDLGRPFKGVLFYSKGILNNGSHFIDLLSFLFGACSEIRVLDAGRTPKLPDPEPDVLLRYGDISIYLLAGREECFSCGNLDLFATDGAFHYPLGNLRPVIRKVHADPLFPGYKVLESGGEQLDTNVDRYMYFVIDALVQSIKTGKPPASNISTAVETMKTVDQIINMTRKVCHE